MGIRKKILLGFVAIGFILFLSGVVAVFEMTRLTDLISGLLTSNIQTITSSNTIEQVVLKQNSYILDIWQNELEVDQAELGKDIITLTSQVDFIAANMVSDEGKVLVEKLKTEAELYQIFLSSIPSVLDMQREQQMEWYASYEKLFLSLTETTSEITKLNQNILSENAIKLEGNYYRMIMPAAIAIIAGVFMIFFFNYFISTYFVKPVIQIKKNIKSFLSSRSPYSVKISTNDEINELNEEVTSLVNLLKKREKECSSLQNENREA